MPFHHKFRRSLTAAGAAILFMPTVIAGIYGMNFRHMPGVTEWYGFTLSLLVMLVSSVTLYTVLSRQHYTVE